MSKEVMHSKREAFTASSCAFLEFKFLAIGLLGLSIIRFYPNGDSGSITITGASSSGSIVVKGLRGSLEALSSAYSLSGLTLPESAGLSELVVFSPLNITGLSSLAS